MQKGLFALLLAGTLMAPQSALTLEKQGTFGAVTPVQAEAAGYKLPLPPIPYLDTMPFLSANPGWRGPQVDMLLGDEPALPFLAQTAVPSRRCSRKSDLRDTAANLRWR